MLMGTKGAIGLGRRARKAVSRVNQELDRLRLMTRGAAAQAPLGDRRHAFPLAGRGSSEPRVRELESWRLGRAKLAYTTRRVPVEEMVAVVPAADARAYAPRTGDLLLARIETVGQHPRLELRDGRRAHLFVGDEVVVSYGARYAPDQFEAEVPADLAACDLVAAGGVAAQRMSGHAKMSAPTRLEPVGLVVDRDGTSLNLDRWRLALPARIDRRPPTVAVVGSSMNAGKTTAAASLVRGLTVAGHRVGAAKVTGTGAGGDMWHMTDAGAEIVVDFTDAGLPSTYLASPAVVAEVFELLTGHLAHDGMDVVVIEVADGLFQRETEALLRTSLFGRGVDEVLFAGSDALGASAGVAALRSMGLRVSAVSGVLSASPLAIREAEAACGVPVLDSAALRDGASLALAGSGARAIDPKLEEPLPVPVDDDSTLTAA
jgi:hypothetical protein